MNTLFRMIWVPPDMAELNTALLSPGFLMPTLHIAHAGHTLCTWYCAGVSKK